MATDEIVILVTTVIIVAILLSYVEYKILRKQEREAHKERLKKRMKEIELYEGD